MDVEREQGVDDGVRWRQMISYGDPPKGTEDVANQ